MADLGDAEADELIEGKTYSQFWIVGTLIGVLAIVPELADRRSHTLSRAY